MLRLPITTFENFLKSQGCEVYVPGIVNFVLFKIDNRLDDIKLYGGNTIKYQINKILLIICYPYKLL